MRFIVSRCWLMIVLMAILMVLSPLSGVRGAGDKTEDAKKAIEAIMRSWDAAAAKKDMAGVFKYFAADYVIIFPSGKKFDLTNAKANSRTTFETAESFQQTSTLKSIVLKGDTATTEESGVGEITVKKPTGILSKIRITSTGRSFWVFSKGQWLLKRTRVIDMGTSVDGQPVPTQFGGGESP